MSKLNNKVLYIIIGTIVSLLVIEVFFFSSIQLVVFNRSFYNIEFNKHQVSRITKMSDEDLVRSINVLLDYIRDRRDDITINADIDGINREVFNEKEKKHMVDVKALYMNCRLYQTISIGILFIAFFLLIYKKHLTRVVYKAWKHMIYLMLLIFAVIFAAIMIDFYAFWTFFHHLVFTNELWLLDPNTDIMILMVPEGFFYDTVVAVIVIFFIEVAASTSILAYLTRRSG